MTIKNELKRILNKTKICLKVIFESILNKKHKSVFIEDELSKHGLGETYNPEKNNIFDSTKKDKIIYDENFKEGHNYHLIDSFSSEDSEISNNGVNNSDSDYDTDSSSELYKTANNESSLTDSLLV